MREMTRKSVVRMAAFGGGAALVLGGAAAWASIPSSNGTIYGCYADSNGATRIIDPGKKKCSGSESPISWSQRGPAGARGPQGYTGKTGKTGAAGKNGAKGAPGTPGTNRPLGLRVRREAVPRRESPRQRFVRRGMP